MSLNIFESYFNSDYVTKGNLQFAFGLMQYDDNPESIEDPTYGTLQAYYKTWGLDN